MTGPFRNRRLGQCLGQKIAYNRGASLSKSLCPPGQCLVLLPVQPYRDRLIHEIHCNTLCKTNLEFRLYFGGCQLKITVIGTG